MTLLQALNWRYAVKAFDSQRLLDEQINQLIEAVRLSPAAYGLQPYKLLVIESLAVKQVCRPYSYGQDKVVNCSHLLVLASQTSIKPDDIKQFITELANTQGVKIEQLSGYQQAIEADLLNLSISAGTAWAKEQSFIALGTLLASAAILNIDTCPITGFDVTGIDKVLNLSEQGLTATVLIPVGIRSTSDLSAYRPKHRVSQAQLEIRL
jgi:nitroreductase